MEGELDDIEDGKIDWRAAMQEFYEKFKTDPARAESEMQDIKRMEIPTDLICDKCGKPMVIRWGKHGRFVGCTGYPECTSTREPSADMVEGAPADLAEEGAEEYCENCGREMVLKKGRFGQFYACTGYPDCKTTKPLNGKEQKKADVLLDEDCPTCGSKLVMKSWALRRIYGLLHLLPGLQVRQAEDHRRPLPQLQRRPNRRTPLQRGKTFFGCNRYPTCDFVAWGRPIAEPCPDCGSSYLIEKHLKSGSWAQCPSKECKYKRVLEPVAQPA